MKKKITAIMKPNHLELLQKALKWPKKSSLFQWPMDIWPDPKSKAFEKVLKSGKAIRVTISWEE